MRYQPTDLPDRSHVGEHWTRYQLRSLQIILQATHGVVSGEPVFFKRAFGNSFEEFETLLARPHHFIFNREWYEHRDGKAEFEEYSTLLRKLGKADRAELVHLLSSVDPSLFAQLPNRTTSTVLRDILRFYRPLCKEAEEQIWHTQKATPGPTDLPEDERVEDADLDAEDATATPSPAALEGKIRRRA